jgi:hypothetical protein
MTQTPEWLATYYGKYTPVLNPQVVIDGKKVAVVRLVKNEAPRGFAKVGYVLIRKDGRHHGGMQRSLHEGHATEEHMIRMQKIHAEADSKR